MHSQMSLFSKKSTFVIGSLIGSVIGLLFAKESGTTIRGKLKSAKTPQKKFEALFQEYLKVGKSAIAEAQESETIKELLKGGREIIAELKQKAENEGGSAIKFAHKKASEVMKEVEKQANGLEKNTRRKVATAKNKVLRKTATAQKKVKRAVRKLNLKKKVARKVASVKKSTKKVIRKKTSRKK